MRRRKWPRCVESKRLRRNAKRFEHFVEARSLKFIAESCGAEAPRGADGIRVGNVCTDSRRAGPGDVFFAIRGERHDGHDFIHEVVAKKVAAVVVAESQIHRLATVPSVPRLVVDDPRRALGRLAGAYRRQFDLPVVCIAGSNGKTTTKELLASILRQKFPTLWSEASFNNDVGVPLTLLRLETAHRVAVLEAGTNHPGELAPLVKMIRPKFGVITNIGREHLEFFGDLEGVAREEGALAEELPEDGTLFLNGDSEWSESIAARTRARVIRIGLGETNDWRVQKIRLDKNGTTFHVEAPDQEFCGEYRVPLLGRHQAVNALLAIAVSEELGLGRSEIRDGLADCPPPKMRLQFEEAGGIRLLDDTYNANADSTLAALETLCELPLQGRRVAVLGDMNELGAQAAAAHAEIGRRAAQWRVGQLFAVGRMASVTAQAARKAGLTRVMEFENVETAAGAVQKFLKPGDVVLFKASRGVRLERIVELLKAGK
jgi:UDP-N-acetylmuramoyl-tripeptide--D-alanyl-D-alanine ligase